jgi:hypothetical protein
VGVTECWKQFYNSSSINRTVCLEVNTGKTKNILNSGKQNAGLNLNINISFENVANFKCLGTTVTTQNLNLEGVKSSLNLGNSCCHSDQKLFPSNRLSKNAKIKLYIKF